MAEIIYSPAALRDLEKIGDYISEQLKNPIAALNTVNTIQDRIDKLADFPLMGTLLSALYDDVDVGEYRFLVCLHYLAFYRAERGNVHVDRIMYGRRDYITILFGELPQDETE
ncbi:MAG: type II toxin-antitoxin system RelE/ParE family toxin [Oscillospiraceae bacterium]|nr:type II toxin-antitoxin system RelE/ParE family toxin [Oscillospiraceae bacterium]